MRSPATQAVLGRSLAGARSLAQISGASMSWALVLGLAAAAYGFKALGLVVIGSRPLPAGLERCLALVPAALLAALVITNTFTDGTDLVLDERVAGVAVAVVAAWRKAPFVVVVILAAATSALLRQV